MGSSKALLEAEGVPFLTRVIGALRAGGCDPVVVVVSDMEGDEAALAREAGGTLLHNAEPGDGPITSLRLAITEVGDEAAGIAFCPVDHPGIRPDTVERLLEAFAAGGAPLVLPTYRGRRGHPGVFARELFPDLLSPDLPEGARTVVLRNLERARLVEVDDDGVITDVDTPDDYLRFGKVHVDATEAARMIEAATSAGGRAASLLVVGASADLPGVAPVGSRLVAVHAVDEAEPRVYGALADPALDSTARQVLSEALRAGEGGGLRPLPAGEGSVEVYLEIRDPVQELVVVGAGHIALPLVRIGAMLGLRVIVLDDRPEFARAERFPDATRVMRADFDDPFADVPIHPGSHVILVTRGHKYDYQCLVHLLRGSARPGYVGMIGSRRRVRATFVQLLDEGISRDRLAWIHAPVGLDLHAETPEEIAVAVAAELVKIRRGGSGASLRDVERVAERFFEDPVSATEVTP